MRLGRLSVFTLALLPLGGCGDSGQTGSPLCGTPNSCVCDSLWSGLPVLRVQVESSEDDWLTARVVEYLWQGDTDEIPGPRLAILPEAQLADVIGGRVLDQWLCGPSPMPWKLTVGSELLVSYRMGWNKGYPNCPETETAAACDEYRNQALLEGSFHFAVPWSDPLEFGRGRRISLQDFDQLRTPEGCLERFPLPKEDPCDGTPGPESACSVVRPAAPLSASVPAFWLALGFSVLLYRLARRGSE